MSIRKLLSLALVMITLIVIGFSGLFGWQKINRMRDVDRAYARIETVQAFANSLGLIVAERGALNLAINQVEPGDVPKFTTLSNNRKASDEAWKQATDKAAILDALNGDDDVLGPRISALTAKLTDSRTFADQQLSQPIVARAVTVPQLFAQMNTISTAISDLMREQVTSLALVDGPAYADAQLANQAWLLREMAGTQSIALSSLVIAAKPVATAARDQFLIYEGQLRQIWLGLLAVRNNPATAPTLIAAIDSVKTGHMDVYDGIKADLVPHFADGLFPYGADAIRAKILPSYQPVIGLRDQAYTQALNSIRRAHDEARQQILVAAIATALAFTALVATLLLIQRRVTVPLSRLSTLIQRIASGSYDLTVPYGSRRDEIGRLASAITILQENSAAAERLSREAEMARAREAAAEQERLDAERQTQRLERQRLEDERRQGEQAQRRAEKIATAIDAFRGEIAEVIRGLAHAANDLNSNAQLLGTVATDAARQSEQVAQASEQTSSNIETVASATDQLTASSQEVGRQTSRSATMSGQAVAIAEQADRDVRALAAAADQIGSVARLIEEIAGQTNLLALNATIEAARAGATGKGFAVVASEVKNLASQTAKATEQISAQIQGIQSQTRHTVEAIGEIGGAISQMAEVTTTIASAVEQQVAATAEIARNVDQAAHGTAGVAGGIRDVRTMVAEVGSASSGVLGATDALNAQATQLKTSVERFLTLVAEERTA